MANRFRIDDCVPTWESRYWRVSLRGGVVVAEDRRGYGRVPLDIAAETMRSIVAEIVSGPTSYDAGLIDLVLAAEQYRKQEADGHA